MKQEAEKIYNIEHADNVNIHIDGLFESAEKFNQAVSRIPGLIDCTMLMLSKYANPLNQAAPREDVMSCWIPEVLYPRKLPCISASLEHNFPGFRDQTKRCNR